MNDSKINLETSVKEEIKLNGSNELVQARKEALKSIKQDKEEGFKWLNQDSRNFLASGYLTPGVSAETRIREIADRAEKILGMPGFSDKFYGYMSEGFLLIGITGMVKFWKRKRIAN